MNHTQLIISTAERIRARTYLEIGVSNPEKNFDRIPVKFKTGVDPNPKSRATYVMTSDEFFSFNTQNYDLIFIDGLHEASQVERDFMNSLRLLSRNGIIIIHDTFPDTPKVCNYPRDVKGRWLGDVYKFIPKLNSIECINFVTYTYDNGCTKVWRDPLKSALENVPEVKSYSDFIKYRSYYREV